MPSMGTSLFLLALMTPPIPSHWFSWQSPATPHCFPLAQSAHGPPQSTSDSPAFLVPSVQLPGWQTPPVHTPFWQSAPTTQPCPLPQSGQLLPQSTSVSVPFSTPSVQLGSWQRPPVHTWVVQSTKAPHALPGPHGGHVPPPQSTSLSAAFRT